MAILILLRDLKSDFRFEIGTTFKENNPGFLKAVTGLTNRLPNNHK
jgi:hypothetical protein